MPLGFGKNIWDWDPEKLTPLILLVNVAGSFSATAAIWSKTSFAFTMLRVTEGYLRWLVWFIIISMNIAMGLTALLLWLRCNPVEKTWKPFGPGTCWDINILVRYDIFSAGQSRLVVAQEIHIHGNDTDMKLVIPTAYSAAMDFALALLPWKIVWKLQMKKKERIGVAIAMSMGVVYASTISPTPGPKY